MNPMSQRRYQLAIGVCVGEYELISLLGRGGMGEVWLASDLRADRLVALKFIKPSLLDDPNFRSRFLNEAKTLGRLEHDRIVPLYNVVEDGEYLALVLRFIEGKSPRKGTSLADRIDGEGALPLTFVLSSARDILPALNFAHQHGTIHRDIKPQNVLLDGSGRSFLTDFGIAVADFAERGTLTGSAIGTPEYMSPEQIRDSSKITPHGKGHRTDIYSYGVVLYEMLTGRRPFGHDLGISAVFEIQRAQCSDDPPAPRDLNPAIPESVEKLVLRCLAKSPDDRPQTCAELLDELEAAAAQISAEHPATVLEKRRVPLVRRQAPAKKPKLAKIVWWAAGTMLIAGGIFYAVTLKSVATQSGPRPSGAPTTTVLDRPEKPLTKIIPPTNQGNGGQSTRSSSPTPAPNPRQTDVSSPDAAAAILFVKSAEEHDRKGEECDALADLREAFEKDARVKPRYGKLLETYTRRCNQNN